MFKKQNLLVNQAKIALSIYHVEVATGYTLSYKRKKWDPEAVNSQGTLIFCIEP